MTSKSELRERLNLPPSASDFSAFEAGEMNGEQELRLFARIWNSRSYMWLQGFYGRRLRDHIESGNISIDPNSGVAYPNHDSRYYNR